MQQLLHLVRHLVYPSAAVFLLWVAYLVLFSSPFVSENTGKILAVYNGDSTIQNCNETFTPDKENDSEQALAGFCEAVSEHSREHSHEVDLLNVHAELQNQTGEKQSKIYEHLASRVARGSVLGVISLLTSPDSLPVVRFCRTMRIPLLLAVAANNDLMAPAEDTYGIVFRMMPTNGRQASNMADWLKGKLHEQQQLLVALFHEPNSFGEFLNRHLTSDLQDEIRGRKILTYDYEVTENLEFAGLMPQLWCDQIDLVVYLGFASRALDLLNKLKWYRADKDQVTCRPQDPSRSFKDLTVLLSSGAYQEDLNDREKYKFPFKIFAMLPTRPPRNKEANPKKPRNKEANPKGANASQDEEQAAASAYGYDSYALLERLAMQRFRIPAQLIEHPKTGHEYRFDEHGELQPAETNRYKDYQLLSSLQ